MIIACTTKAKMNALLTTTVICFGFMKKNGAIMLVFAEMIILIQIFNFTMSLVFIILSRMTELRFL